MKTLAILVIEDSEDDAELTVHEIEKGGYELIWQRVETAEEMDASIHSQEWDVVLCDYELPRFSVFSALELLNNSDLDLPFIVVSGKIGEEAAVRVMKAGAHDFIMKRNMVRLIPAIERELVEAKIRGERRQTEDTLIKTLNDLEIQVEKRTAILSKANEVLLSEIHERMKAEDDLRQSESKLRELSRHLESLRESERSAIAMEIHDELGQSLTALKMDVSWLKGKLEPNEVLCAKVISMSQVIDEIIHNIRRISSDLRPRILDDLGITAAIEWQLKNFSKQTGIRYKFKSKPEIIEIDKSLSTTIFRIVQESLTNIVKHADASSIEMTMNKESNGIVVEITDNGKGISEEQMFSGDSLGLLGIQERAASWGGSVGIEGNPGKGTKITINIPELT